MQVEERLAGPFKNASKPNFLCMEPSPWTYPFIKLAQLGDISRCPDFPFPSCPLTYTAPSLHQNQASKDPITGNGMRGSAEERIGRVGLSLRVGRGWAPAYFFFFFFLVKSDPIVLLWAGFSSLRGSPGLMLNQVQNQSVGSICFHQSRNRQPVEYYRRRTRRSLGLTLGGR